MRLHRFLADMPLESSFEINGKDLVHQLKNVLKLKVGEKIILFNQKGESAEVKLLEFFKDKIQYELVAFTKKPVGGKRTVILATAIVKRDNFEWIAQKATEIGIDEIVPLYTQHSVKLGLQASRIQRIMTEAVEQSGRFKVPILSGIMKLEAAINKFDNKTKKIFFEANAPRISPADLKDASKVMIFVGPEGGWTPEERNLAEKYGCISRSLQDYTLRTETAAIVGSYMVSNL